jgi:sensor histidine kinase YesM
VLCKNHSPRTLQVLENFMDYLQANFTAVAADKPIPFSDELKHTKAYLAVESARRDELLSVTYDTPHTDFSLPALTLQPIVENAVKHGSGNERFRLEVLIRTAKTADGSEITVEDNGPGFAAVPDAQSDAKETHVGLANVRERLELMCGGSLSIDSGPEGGTAVTIRIPDRQ